MRRWPNTSHQKVISIIAKWHSGKNYFGPPSRSKSQAVVEVVGASGAGWWVSISTYYFLLITLVIQPEVSHKLLKLLERGRVVGK